MKFQILDNGSLQITAETAAEVKEIVTHYKLDILQYVDALSAGMLTYEVKPSSRDNSAWFAVSSFVDPAWLKPYMVRLEKITGYYGPTPTIEDTPKYPGSPWAHNLQYTHIVTQSKITSEGMVFEGFINCGDWNKKKAAERAVPMFADYVRENLGARKHEPEFISLNNGLFQRNPKYLTRHAPHPECSSSSLFDCLLTWWLNTQATECQKDIMVRALACHVSVCKTDTLGSWLIREYQGLRTSWESPLVTYEQFKGL